MRPGYQNACPERTFNRREILLIKNIFGNHSGQVLSGYVRDQNENIIAGIKVIITSTYSIGLDQMGTVIQTLDSIKYL